MKYRTEIDGLRALAVVPVILFHAGFSTFSGGFVGVDIFFVISGYLITTILISEIKSGNFSIANFYERRARRILPALFFVVAVCIPFAWTWLPPEEMKSFGQSIVGVFTFSSNILFWKDSGYFDTSAELKPLLHTWSLSVEEQFYILLPIFLLLTWKLGKNRVVFILLFLTISSLLMAEYLSTRSPNAAFYLLPSRAWELAAGCLVGFYLEGRTRIASHNLVQQTLSLTGLFLIIFGIFYYSKEIPFPSLYTIAPVLGTVLIIIFTGPSTLVGRLLSQKYFVGIGIISYSAYLWHQPLFSFSRHITLGEPNRISLIATFASIFVLSYLSYIFVEKPFRRKHFITKNHVLYISVIFSFSFIGLGVSAHISEGFLSRLSNNASKVYQTSKDISATSGSTQNPAFIGDPSNVLGAIIGDSHANSIAESLGASLSHLNIGLKNYIKNGCPPARGLYRFDIPSYGASCDEFYSTVYDEITKDNTIKYVVISARFTLYIESNRFDNKEGGKEIGATQKVIYDGIEYKNEKRPLIDRKNYVSKRLIDDIRYLIESGKHVILIYPIPEVGWDVPKAGFIQSKNSNEGIEISTSFERFVERNRYTISTLDSIGSPKNLSRIYPHKYLCNNFEKDRCSAIFNSVSFYYDSNHLTNLGARIFTDEIANIFQAKPTLSTSP